MAVINLKDSNKLTLNKSFVHTVQKIINNKDYMNAYNTLFGFYYKKKYINECMYMLSVLTDIKYDNDDFAMLMLGLIHFYGIFVIESGDIAKAYINKSLKINENNSHALYWCYILQDIDIYDCDTVERKYYEEILMKCIKLGNIQAYKELYILKYGDYGDVYSALDEYEDNELILCHDYKDAIKYCSELIKHDVPYGYYYLARLYRDNHNLGEIKDEENKNVAIQLYLMGYTLCTNYIYCNLKSRIKDQISKLINNKIDIKMLSKHIPKMNIPEILHVPEHKNESVQESSLKSSGELSLESSLKSESSAKSESSVKSGLLSQDSSEICVMDKSEL
jgi:hypothetical protein